MSVARGVQGYSERSFKIDDYCHAKISQIDPHDFNDVGQSIAGKFTILLISFAGDKYPVYVELIIIHLHTSTF